MKKILLKIEGMTCSACSNGLEKYLSKQEGITNVSVNLVMSNALVEYDEEKIDIKKIENFVKKAGFKSLGLYDNQKEENLLNHNKIKVVIFGILAYLVYAFIMKFFSRFKVILKEGDVDLNVDD